MAKWFFNYIHLSLRKYSIFSWYTCWSILVEAVLVVIGSFSVKPQFLFCFSIQLVLLFFSHGFVYVYTIFLTFLLNSIFFFKILRILWMLNIKFLSKHCYSGKQFCSVIGLSVTFTHNVILSECLILFSFLWLWWSLRLLFLWVTDNFLSD